MSIERAMARPEQQGDKVIIDLASDSEDDVEAPNAPEWDDDQSVFDFDDGNDAEFENLVQGYGQDEAPTPNDPETIDLTGIPDIDVPPSSSHDIDAEAPQPHAQARDSDGNGMILTEAACLQMVLNVLPDIAVDHALKTIGENTTDATRTVERCGRLITELLDGEGYPKEADKATNKKRKRGDEESLSDYEREERDPAIGGYEQDALTLLKDEFPSVPVRHLTNTLKKEKTLFKAFGVLEEQLQTYRQVATPFNKIGTPRNKRGVELILIEQGSRIPKELHAAKRRKEISAAKRQQAEKAEQAERMNLQRAQADNQMGECACCFDDVPLNRMISCNGPTAHSYCVNCPRQQIETLMGQSRCRPTCFGVSDCTGTFTRTQLQQVLSEKTFERLEHMQQLEEIKNAGLDFLSECPFCDFKMECPPVDVDKEFRCESSKCGKTSCRLCDKETHIPLSCEEARKDGKLTYRHVIEEAMSKALIRQCNQCKQPFVKEMGCNKMTCSHCRNLQCYVCSKNVTDYNHFGAGKCPLHDNIEERHEEEVKKAADEARDKLRAENPDLSEADLMVQVSDQVKQAEQARKGRAAAEVEEFPYHMVGDHLRNRAQAAGQADMGAGAGLPQRPGQLAMQQRQQALREQLHEMHGYQVGLHRPAPAPQYVHPYLDPAAPIPDIFQHLQQIPLRQYQQPFQVQQQHVQQLAQQQLVQQMQFLAPPAEYYDEYHQPQQNPYALVGQLWAALPGLPRRRRDYGPAERVEAPVARPPVPELPNRRPRAGDPLQELDDLRRQRHARVREQVRNERVERQRDREQMERFAPLQAFAQRLGLRGQAAPQVIEGQPVEREEDT